MLRVFVCLGCLLVTVNGVAKTWKFTNDVMDPHNWEEGKPSQNCKGLIFPEQLGSVASVFELYVDELVLPTTGELEIREGGFIQITENSPSCLRIKELKHKHWLSPNNWNFEENAAIPDAEKVPCVHDDVVFSSQATVAVFYPEVTVSVNSIQIGGVNLSNAQWQNFLQSDYGGEQFYTIEFEESVININPRECSSKSGCTCHDSEELAYWVCDNMEKRDEAPCFDPVTPIGHCSPICGGVVLVDTTNNFDLKEFQNNIPKYEKVDTYASKVMQNNQPFIQVVFAEKDEYTELSTKAANDFHSQISKDLSAFRAKTARLDISGICLPKGSASGTAFSIILGTFVAVSVMFLCIYVVYVGPLKDYDFSSRLPITQFSFGNLRPFWFTKFENRDEGQMSMAGSMISLEKAFDNPMYGSHRPSTSSAAVDVVVVAETEPANQSETIIENPAYSEMKCEQIEIEDIEETVE